VCHAGSECLDLQQENTETRRIRDFDRFIIFGIKQIWFVFFLREPIKGHGPYGDSTLKSLRRKREDGGSLRFNDISHAKSAKGAELQTLLLTLALEGSQLHATESAEVDGRRKTLIV
jgi:hypothetical protein